MNKKTTGIILLIVGVLIILSGTVLNLMTSSTALYLGIAIIIIGAIVLFMSKKADNSENAQKDTTNSNSDENQQNQPPQM